MPMTLMGPPLRVKVLKAVLRQYNEVKHASSSPFKHREANRCHNRSHFLSVSSNQQLSGACVWLPACTDEPPLLPRRPCLSFVFELRRTAPVQYWQVGDDGKLLLRPAAKTPDTGCVDGPSIAFQKDRISDWFSLRPSVYFAASA